MYDRWEARACRRNSAIEPESNSSPESMLSRECYKWLWVVEVSEEHCTDSEAPASHKSRTACTYCVTLRILWPVRFTSHGDAIGKAAWELAIFQLRFLPNMDFPHHPLKSSSSWRFIPATQAHLNCLYWKLRNTSSGLLLFCLLWSPASDKFLLCSSWDLVDQISISIFGDRLRIFRVMPHFVCLECEGHAYAEDAGWKESLAEGRQYPTKDRVARISYFET